MPVLHSLPIPELIPCSHYINFTHLFILISQWIGNSDLVFHFVTTLLHVWFDSVTKCHTHSNFEYVSLFMVFAMGVLQWLQKNKGFHIRDIHIKKYLSESTTNCETGVLPTTSNIWLCNFVRFRWSRLHSKSSRRHSNHQCLSGHYSNKNNSHTPLHHKIMIAACNFIAG